MNTEQLLICAKAVGKEPRIQNDEIYIHYSDEGCDGWIYYNPFADHAQAMELLKWLVSKHGRVIELWTNQDGLWNLDTQGKAYYENWTGQSLNEAIIKAVCAMEDTL